MTDNLSKWLRDRVKSFPKLQDGCNSLKSFIEHNISRQTIPSDAADSKSFLEKNELAAMDIDQPDNRDLSQSIGLKMSVINQENDDEVVVFRSGSTLPLQEDVKNECT